jgi:large subunit ribosomal protein L18
MKILKKLAKQKQRRQYRVRNRVRRTAGGRPRLSVFRSNKHIYAQLIDDETGSTLVSASSQQSGVCPEGSSGGNRSGAAAVGAAIAARATEKGIRDVVFDRGHYKYHGRVAALADAAREGGLVF